MVAFPLCKINLGLSIIRKRDDGFHDIETCFYPVPWTDIVEVIISEHFSFSTSGNAIPGRAEDNLCVRAYQLLKVDFHLSPVSIHLHKVIPMGAGLGGGSADAAYTLSLINALFSLGLNSKDLTAYAARLGSDCAFFIHNVPMIGTGRGEVLTPVSMSLQGKFLVIVNPDIHVSTADAYAGVTPVLPDISIREIMNNYPVQEWSGVLKNDFEGTVLNRYPVIREIKEKLYDMGALYASMSGSGSSVFGVFENSVEANDHFEGLAYWSGEAVL